MRQLIKQALIIQAFTLISGGIYANINWSIPPIDYYGNSSPTIIYIIDKDTLSNNKNLASKTMLTESMVSFNAEVMRNTIDLRWNIANGNSYDQFFVERSLDGTNFEKVGEVKGNMSAPTLSEYGYTDFVKPSITRKNDLYYRLKQIGSDNKTTYSKVLIVRMYNTQSVTAVSVTPDPSVNDIMVNVQLKEKSFVVMTVKDNSGNLIIKKASRADLGANSFSLDGTSKLEPGNYLLEIIINSNERMTMQLIKG